MSGFKIHKLDEATGARHEAMNAITKLYVDVPNVLGALAESPAALQGYEALARAMANTTFSPTERHVVWFTINLEHGCHYCMSAHTPHAIREDVPEEVIATARSGGVYEDPKLEALRAFTLAMVQERGWVPEEKVDAFLAAGFTRENVFEIVMAIAHKVMTNYTNHLVEPPLDERFQDHAWSAPTT